MEPSCLSLKLTLNCFSQDNNTCGSNVFITFPSILTLIKPAIFTFHFHRLHSDSVYIRVLVYVCMYAYKLCKVNKVLS